MKNSKSNTIYIIFSIIVVVALVFFIAIPVVRNNKDKRNSIDYNTIGNIGEYKYKITDATYITDTKDLYFVFSWLNDSVKKDDELIKPKITLIELTYTNDKGSTVTDDVTKKVTEEKRTSTSKYITIPDVSEKYQYVKVTFESGIKAYDESDTIDEFGDTVKGEHHKKETFEEYVMFDEKDITKRTLEEDKKHRAKELAKIQKENEAVLDGADSKNDNADDNIVVPKKSDDSSKPDETSVTTTTTKTTTKQKNDSSRVETTTTTTRNNGSGNTTAGGGGYSGNGGYSGGGNGGYSGGGYTEYYNEPDNDYDNGYDNQTETQRQTEQQTQAPTQTQTQAPQTKTPETEPPYINVRGLKIECDFENNNVKLKVGETTKLKGVVSPDNANNKELEWKSLKEEIATVDKNGKVKAVATGKAIIQVFSVDSPSVTASIMITVE